MVDRHRTYMIDGHGVAVPVRSLLFFASLSHDDMKGPFQKISVAARNLEPFPSLQEKLTELHTVPLHVSTC